MTFVSEIYRSDTFSVMIVGGQSVDTALVLQQFVKCTHSSQRRVFYNLFTMFERNTEFRGCLRVDLAYGNQYD